ncbi:HNH endonuclease [Staphylococcus aureus]
MCGYAKHYEVCHIKAINQFDSNTRLSEVNDINNLVALCRNCHWELDHGLISISP